MPTGIYQRTDYHRKRISLAMKAKPTKYWLDKNRSDEFKKKVSESLKGHIVSIETREKISKIHKGKPKPFHTGEKCHWWWKGGVRKENEKIRAGIEYKLWRESVFKRDDWTCQDCRDRGGRLQAHHIKAFAYFPELRFAIDNGITLCEKCHKKTDNFGFKSKNK